MQIKLTSGIAFRIALIFSKSLSEVPELTATFLMTSGLFLAKSSHCSTLERKLKTSRCLTEDLRVVLVHADEKAVLVEGLGDFECTSCVHVCGHDRDTFIGALRVSEGVLALENDLKKGGSEGLE